MVKRLIPVTISLVCLAVFGAAQQRDVLVPAGTLVTCTMNEPNFSTATVNVGDPFLCSPHALEEFGQNVFPRGTYMVGHLEAAKDPGRFVGKGYLQLTIDRVGLPTTDLPLDAKIITVAGYKVDRSGDIIGHGHAERDVIEWMFPPLWPWKIVTLPARGPRPDLKGEVRITMRLMDDLSVPQLAAGFAAPNVAPQLPPPAPGWHYFGQPQTYVPAAPASAPRVRTSLALSTQAGAADAAIAPPGWPAAATLFITTDGGVVAAMHYWRDANRLLIELPDGSQTSLALANINWDATARTNTTRGVRVTLHALPAGATADADNQ